MAAATPATPARRAPETATDEAPERAVTEEAAAETRTQSENGNLGSIMKRTGCTGRHARGRTRCTGSAA